MIPIDLAVASPKDEMFNDYPPEQPTDAELEQKYTVLQTFIYPEGRGYLVAVSDGYSFPMPNPMYRESETHWRKQQVAKAEANANELAEGLDYELLDRALVLVGDFSEDGLPDVMIQMNVPKADGARDDNGLPVIEKTWFSSIPNTEMPNFPTTNLPDSVVYPPYDYAKGYGNKPAGKPANR